MTTPWLPKVFGRVRLRIHPVLRYAAPAVYVVALLAVCVVRGIPASRDAVFLWVLLGLACVVAGTGRGTIRGILVDWLPLAVVLFAYDVLRGYADSFLTAHVTPQLDFDRWLFAGTVPTVWLQERLWHGASAIDWIDWASWVVYLTHFFATLTVAAGLWLLRRPLLVHASSLAWACVEDVKKVIGQRDFGQLRTHGATGRHWSLEWLRYSP